MSFLSNTITRCAAVGVCLFALSELTANGTTPIVNFTFPDTDGEQLSGMVNVTVNAADVAGISSVEFFIDSASQGTVTSTPYQFPLDTSTLSNEPHQFMVTATDTNGGQASQSMTIYTLNNFTPILINCGGGMVTDGTDVYQADEDYSRNSSIFFNSSIAGSPVYQTARYGSNFAYTIPLPPCKFNVTLQFAEIYFQAPGQRVFTVALNGANLITNLDLYREVGFGNPYVAEFPVQDTKTLDIRLKAAVNNGLISAIQINPIPPPQ